MTRFRSIRFLTLTALALLSGMTVWVIGHGENEIAALHTASPAAELGGHTLNYYRAPEHASPPVNQLDPYDSFLKTANGDLIIAASGTSVFSSFTQSTYQGYLLKTPKGTPILAYQETPTRRRKHKSNCHGLTFLAGDYWLLGSQVERILSDNDWVNVREASARRGDVAVYRDWKGRIVHTARVVGRDDAGRILVNSKNGFDPEIKAVRAVEVIPN